MQVKWIAPDKYIAGGHLAIKKNERVEVFAVRDKHLWLRKEDGTFFGWTSIENVEFIPNE